MYALSVQVSVLSQRPYLKEISVLKSSMQFLDAFDGFEPPTDSLIGNCSSQLSYKAMYASTVRARIFQYKTIYAYFNPRNLLATLKKQSGYSSCAALPDNHAACHYNLLQRKLSKNFTS